MANRRTRVVLAILLGWSATAVRPAAQDGRPPNVVLLVSDDQWWGDFGFMGSDVVETPHLDRLAAEGLVFPRGYVPTALCRASLATLVTGLYPHQHAITGNDPPKGTPRERMLEHIAAVATLPDLLGAAGYRSLQTGKWWEGDCTCGGFTEGMTHGDPQRGGRHGDEGLAIGRTTMAPATDFIDACASDDTPFFLWYAPLLPHTPHDPSEELLARYADQDVPGPVRRYRAMCTWFDETCGVLLDHLEAAGVADDTLVVLVTDNGWLQRPDGPGFLPRSKRSPYEGGVRTPLVLRWPGHIAPERRDVPVSSVDVPATILRACGLDVPAHWPGVDLREARAGTRGPVFGAAFTHDVVSVDYPELSLLTRWVLRDPYKLLVHADPAQEPELYDVRADPAEEHLLDDEPLAAELREELDAWWPARDTRPNLLVVVTDDQRYDQLGAAGHPYLATPHMDALAARGVRFENAYVTSPVCAASRASILTGQREGRHGYTFGTPPMEAHLGADAWPKRLHAMGYRTGFVGKWGVRFTEAAMEGMFDAFRPLSLPYLQEDGSHLTARTADEAIGFLDGRVEGEPFALMVSFWAPHAEDSNPEQYVPPPDLAAMYDGVDVPPPPLAEEGFAALPPFLQESLGRRRWAWRFDEREKQQRMTRAYWAMVSGVDRELGRLLAALEDRGLDDDTVVVFTSDNGYFLGERGLAGKWLPYGRALRVPLIVADPRADASTRGTVRRELVLNVDLAPTLCELGGNVPSSAHEGSSLLPLLRGEEVPWRTEFVVEHRFDHAEIPKSRGLWGARWVYASYDGQDPPYEQLFDRASDPDQLVDLARDPAFAEKLLELRTRCRVLGGF